MNNEQYRNILRNNGFSIIDNAVSIVSLMKKLGKKRFSEYDVDMFATKVLQGTIAHKTSFKESSSRINEEFGINYIDGRAVDDVNEFLEIEMSDFIAVFKEGKLSDVLVSYDTMRALVIKFSLQLEDNLVNYTQSYLEMEHQERDSDFAYRWNVAYDFIIANKGRRKLNVLLETWDLQRKIPNSHFRKTFGYTIDSKSFSVTEYRL